MVDENIYKDSMMHNSLGSCPISASKHYDNNLYQNVIKNVQSHQEHLDFERNETLEEASILDLPLS